MARRRFRRSRRSKRPRFRRRSRFGRRKSVRCLSRLLTRIRRPPCEIKYYNYNAIGQSVTTTGTIYTGFNSIGQGLDQAQRIGDKITPRRLSMHLRIICEPFHNATNGHIRFILVQDKEWRQDIAVTGDPGGVLQGADWRQFWNYNQFGRFKRLWDKTYDIRPMSIDTVVPAGAAGTIATYNIEPATYSFTIKKNFKRLRTIQYTTNDAASVNHGAIYMIVIADPSAVLNSSFDMFSRLTYTDS